MADVPAGSDPFGRSLTHTRRWVAAQGGGKLLVGNRPFDRFEWAFGVAGLVA